MNDESKTRYPTYAEEKIKIVKKKIATIKKIEKIEKEVAKLEKQLKAKKAKIEELGDNL